MPAPIADVSQALGDFMLKGYVLTDQSCPTPGCPVPVLKTPRGKTPVQTFCVKCNNVVQDSVQQTLAKAPPSPSAASSNSRLSRSSTPLTEVSESLNYPEFELLPETDEIRQRREQSDRASSEIGKKLLQGWTMLGEECPNDSCYGVPLVRPPKAGDMVDPRKECVICGGVFKTNLDWAGRETLAPYNANDAKERHPLPNTSYFPVQLENDVNAAASGNVPPKKLDKKRFSVLEAQSVGHPNMQATSTTFGRESLSSTTGDALDSTSEALQLSLQTLSSRLRSLSSHASLDLNSISMTADAINKVAQALGQVRQLRSNS